MRRGSTPKTETRVGIISELQQALKTSANSLMQLLHPHLGAVCRGDQAMQRRGPGSHKGRLVVSFIAKTEDALILCRQVTQVRRIQQ